MKIARFVILGSLLLIAGCAGSKAKPAGPGPEYVEIENPMQTMGSNQPATMWVPRSYVETGPPRGDELVRMGFAKATGQAEAKAAIAPQPQVVAPAPPPPPLKNRISVLETGQNDLLLPFVEKMRSMAVGVILDPAQSTSLTRFATITNQTERAAFAERLQKEYGTTVTVFIGAPEGLAPGKLIQADIYDGLGGGLVRTVTSTIPLPASSEVAARESVVIKALMDVTAKVKEVVYFLPWYGKVAAVEGDRAYINAGKEANLRVGQVLKVYRGGKVVPGLGFAPGDRLGSIEVSGFVGPNGAFGAIKDGKGVQAGDLVSVE